MAPRVKMTVMTGVAVAMCRGFMARSGCFTPPVSPPLRGLHASSGLASGSPSELPRASASAAAASDGDGWLGATGLLAAAALGVAAVSSSASLRAKRRQPRDVSAAGGPKLRTHTKVYGETGEVRTPDWINPESKKYGYWGKQKLNVPAWLTEGKWRSSFNNRFLTKHPSWYMQYFDKEGNPSFDRRSTYTLNQAVDLLMGFQERSPHPSNRTVEVMMDMNLDQKFPDQQIRTSIKLPHGSGKELKVAVFCGSDEEQEVLELGACAAGDQLAKDIEAGNITFDVLLAKPQMMPRLARLGRILGPLRLMPSPKSGTVVQDYKSAIQDFKMGSTLELRTAMNGLIRIPVAQLAMGKQKVVENIRALWQSMVDNRPAGAKAKFWNSVYVKTSKSPVIKISLPDLPRVEVDEDDDSDDE